RTTRNRKLLCFFCLSAAISRALNYDTDFVASSTSCRNFFEAPEDLSPERLPPLCQHPLARSASVISEALQYTPAFQLPSTFWQLVSTWQTMSSHSYKAKTPTPWKEVGVLGAVRA